MRSAEREAPTLTQPMVLLVDDDPAVLEALGALLRPRLEPAYDVETAASAEEAMELIGDARGTGGCAPIALVITDEKMPGRCGTDLLIALRQDPDHRDGGRIVVTAYAGLASAKKAINEAEVDRYFPKPWDTDAALMPAVASILKRFAQKREIDRLLVASEVTGDAGLDAVRQIRREWWGYLSLQSEEEMAAAGVPSFSEPEDADAKHVLASRLSPREDDPAGCIRLRQPGASRAWILDSLAFRPEEATDALETLLLRTTIRVAADSGAEEVLTAAPALRRDVYEAVGFEPATVGGAAAVAASCGHDGLPPWAVAMAVRTSGAVSGVAADRVFALRFEREKRLCACAQIGCVERDYSKAQRGYYCPLDIREQRVPVGFPGA